MKSCSCADKIIHQQGNGIDVAYESWCPMHGYFTSCYLCNLYSHTTELCRSHRREWKCMEVTTLKEPMDEKDISTRQSNTSTSIGLLGIIEEEAKMKQESIEKYLDVVDNELDRIHVLLRYKDYEKNGGDYDQLVKIMYRFQSELLKFGKDVDITT